MLTFSCAGGKGNIYFGFHFSFVTTTQHPGTDLGGATMEKNYDYIVVDIHNNFYELTNTKKLTLGEIAKQLNIGSEEIVEVNTYTK